MYNLNPYVIYVIKKEPIFQLSLNIYIYIYIYIYISEHKKNAHNIGNRAVPLKPFKGLI